MTKVTRIGVSVPTGLLKDFDETTRRMGYRDRSKAIHVAMRNLITEYQWMHEEEGTQTGAVVILFDHTVRGLEDALTDVQHDFMRIISSTMHIHLDEQNCLEIIAVRGESKTIKAFAQKLAGIRGIKQLKVAITHV